MAGTYTQEGRMAALLAIGGAGGANLTVRLASNQVTISDTTRLVDLVEANFDGYTPYNSNQWSAPAIDTNGDAFILSPVVVFVKAAGSVGNTIYEYFVTVLPFLGPSYLLTVEALSPPVPMLDPNNQVPLRIKLTDRNVTR